MHTDHNPVDEVIVTQKLEVTRVKGSDKKVVNQYEFEKCLGRGQHGQVWVAKDLKNDEQRVVRFELVHSAIYNSQEVSNSHILT